MKVPKTPAGQFAAAMASQDFGKLSISIVQDDDGCRFVELAVTGFGSVLLPAHPEALRHVIIGLEAAIQDIS